MEYTRTNLLLNKANLDNKFRKSIMRSNNTTHAKREMIDAVNKQHSLLTKSFKGGYTGGGSNRSRKKK